MLSKLPSRLSQLSNLSLPRTQSTQVPSEPRLNELSPAQTGRLQSSTALLKPRLEADPALRTIRGDSVFEPLNGRRAREPGDILTGGPGGRPFPLPGNIPTGGPLGRPFPFPFPPVDPQRAAVEKALESGGSVPFVNSDGQTEQVTVTPVPTLTGGALYQVQVGDDTFTVHIEEGSDVDQEAALAQIIDSYSETPEDLRGSLERVVVTPEQHPDGAAATAGDGTITFYEGDKYLTEDIFHHEIGHLIGRQVEEQGDSPLEDLGEVIFGEKSPPIPDGWAEAAEADGNHLNEYTEESHGESGNYTEDFAEAWSEYQRAIDEGPEALAEFERKYPARAEILEDLYPPPA